MSMASPPPPGPGTPWLGRAPGHGGPAWQPASVGGAIEPGLDFSQLAASNRPRRRSWFRRVRDRLQPLISRSSPLTVSLAAHAAVLIILALVVTARRRAERIALDLSFASTEIAEEETVGARIVSPEPPPDEEQPEETTEANKTDAETPAAAPVVEPEPAEHGVGATSEIVHRVPLGMLLEGREEGQRERLVAVFGGSDETEAAVARALAWLAKQQIKTGPEAGLWHLKGPYPDGGTQENPLAATAMALLAFQGAGNTPEAGRYKQVVDKGWTALVKRQLPEGKFDFPLLPHQHTLYSHGMATAALCELFGMTKNPVHQAPAAAALDYAVAAQGPNGGWRYGPGEPGDMSVTGWFVMAIKSGEVAGLPVPPETFARIGDFLESVAAAGGTQYAYQRYSELKRPHGGTPAVSAEGLLARQFLGWDRNDPRLIGGVEGLFLEAPLDWDNAKNVYAWYYVTQVVHNMGGEPWARWNGRLRELLPAKQLTKGREAGSWDPSLDQWGPHGGRLFMTCFCTWMLEVYYRHLPLYETVAPARINQVQHLTPAN
jgi:hypothetical protein